MTFRIAAINGMGAITETSPGVFVTTGMQDVGVMQTASSLLRSEGVDDLSSGAMKVTASAPAAATVNIAAGGAWVENDLYVPGGSAVKYWHVSNNAVITAPIGANASGNPRIDLVCVTVDTTQTPGADGAPNCTYTVTQGTPNVSPVAPSVPAKSTVLAQVAVANGFSTITNANITDRRDEPMMYGRKAILGNNEYYRGYDPSGTLTQLIGVSTSNVIIVGDSIKDNNFMELIGKAVLTAPADTMGVTIPARHFLKIVIVTIPTGGTIGPVFKFNNDSGNNYAIRSSTDGGADTTTITTSNIALIASTVAFPFITVAEFVNFPGFGKHGWVNSAHNSTDPTATQAPRSVIGSAKWFSTAGQITRVDVANLGAGDFAIGSTLFVYGQN